MRSASGRLAIVFNGEIYNFEEVRAELGPHPWRGHSDTEVMLEALERWGVEGAVGRFVGMFAFALWDRQTRKLYLVRDRLGIKPLYYGHAGGSFVFASELKAIREHPDFQPEIDRDAVAMYVRHSYVPSPYCIYKGLRKLAPGRILTLDSATGIPKIHHYWRGEEVARKGQQVLLRASDEEAVEELHDLLRRAVRQRMIADVPLGAFLSGGVDSSTVVALMQAQSQRPVKTFTIGFKEEGYDEAVDARRVAAHLGTEHTELYVTPQDALDVVPLLPEIYDEPFSDSSQIPTFLVSKLARRSVIVSLSGDGGDELFGGYDRYSLAQRSWNLLRPFPRPFRSLMASSLRAAPERWVAAGLRALAPFLPRALRNSAKAGKGHKLAEILSLGGPEALYYRLLSHWENPSEIVPGADEPGAIRDAIHGAFKEVGRYPVNAMTLIDLLNYLPDDILTKVDRASMGVGLEARVPLIDHRVVEFAWKLPLSLKIKKKTTKWILKQVLYKYVPPALIERPKMGFGIPIDRWLRGPLREWAESLLSKESLSDQGLFDAGRVREKWTEHCSGQRNWQYLLWDILIFQEWLRHQRTATRATIVNCRTETGFAQAVTN